MNKFLLRYTVCLLLLAILVSRNGQAEDKFLDSNGVKIAYTVEGQGEPVVLIHGYAANGFMNWGLPGISRKLAEHYQVFTIDARGHGKSGKPHDPKSYGMQMVEDVVRLLDHHQIERAHVIGYSMGGLISHKLAICHPDRLLTLTIGGMGWMEENDKEMKVFVDELSKSFEEGKGLSPLIKRLTPIGSPKPSDQDVEAINAMIMIMNDPKALAAVACGFCEFTVSEKDMLANKVPCLVIVGGLDPIKAKVERMHAKLPNLEVVEIANTDHMSAFGNPQFYKSVSEFLGKHKQK